jgi:hypothetical protein
MSDIKQYLITVHDNDICLQKISLKAPSGMGLQLNEGEWYLQTYGSQLKLIFKTHSLFEGTVSGLTQQLFPIFNLGEYSETTYQTYHRGFGDGWSSAVHRIKQLIGVIK